MLQFIFILLNLEPRTINHANAVLTATSSASLPGQYSQQTNKSA